MKKIGEVNHWFDKINVAVVKLDAPLAVGDEIKVVRNDEEFEDKVESMEIDHEPVDKGKKGDEVAIKISGSTKEGAEIYVTS